MWNEKETDETTKIEHLVLDFSKLILKMKVDQIRKKEDLSKMETITIDSAMAGILKDNGSEIEQFKPVRQIIDFRSILTKKVNLINMAAMISLIVVPFLLQLFCDQADKVNILHCLITCFSGSVFFFTQEIIQMKGYGW